MRHTDKGDVRRAVTTVVDRPRRDLPPEDSPAGVSLPTPPGIVVGNRSELFAPPAAIELVAERYRIVEPLGTGSTGTVWLARDRILGRNVALKRLDVSGSLRALREARAAARVAHLNVVRIYDVVVDRYDHAWIVMEALAGESLATRTVRSGPLPRACVHPIGEGLIAALVTLHAAGVLHRDVKPSNVHLGSDGRVVLTDFGVATPLREVNSADGVVAGTPGYIAPESVVSGAYSPASDMYGLGATLFFATEGTPAFDLRTVEDLVEHAADPSTPPRSHRAGLLEPMITGLLQPRPADRWTADAVKSHLRSHPACTARPAPPGQCSWLPERSRSPRTVVRPRQRASQPDQSPT